MSSDTARRAQARALGARAFSSREWNPVVLREGRARWRGARAFWLALGYAGFLAFTLCWNYSDSQGRASYGGSAMDSFGAAARLGHELFAVLCYCQVGAWLLIAPALTASSLAGERERGLLEGLLLSHLTPAQIVRGKMASALGLIVLLALAGLPVTAVCFLLGGVSPGELAGALAIQLATAISGASIGMAASAVHRRSNAAGGGAIGGVLLWMGATGAAAIGLSIFSLPARLGVLPGLREVLVLIEFSNPFVAVAALISPISSGRGLMAPGWWSVFFDAGYGWLVSAFGMGLLSAWKMRQARVVLSRSPEKFDEPPAIERAAPSTWQAARTPAGPAASQGEARAAAENPEATGWGVGGYWQMPVVGKLVFGNALMRRELTSAWRWAELSVRAQISLTLGVLALMCLAWLALDLIFEGRNSAQGVWWGLMIVYGITGVVFCAASPATGIMRERESGVWEALRLTLLSPAQVAGAKVSAPIVACLGYGAAGWPFLLLSAWRGEIGAGAALCSIVLTLLAWAQVASWSCLAGTRARIASTALTWGIGGPLLAWIGVPLLGQLFNLGLFDSGSPNAWQMLHPAMVLDLITNFSRWSTSGASRWPLSQVMLGLTMQAGVAALLFALAWRAVRRSQRAEKSSISRTS